MIKGPAGVLRSPAGRQGDGRLWQTRYEALSEPSECRDLERERTKLQAMGVNLEGRGHNALTPAWKWQWTTGTRQCNWPARSALRPMTEGGTAWR